VVVPNTEGKHVQRTSKKIRRAAFLIVLVVAALAWATLPAVALASPVYATGTTGFDVSWPNCSATPPKSPRFGIVGVSDGTGYSQNPCLAQEAAWFPSVTLYVNTGWNDQSLYLNPNSPKVCAAGDQTCLAYNYGYNAGLYAFNYANSQNVHASAWWLDVETSNTWNSDVVQNQNSLQGEYDALVVSGVTTVGVYSTTVQWTSVTGGWINHWPSWGATTWTTATQALTYCTGHQFTGGPSDFMQFKPKRSALDQDVAC
jgi:hypothetical protein